MNNPENVYQPLVGTPAPPKKKRGKVLLIILAVLLILLCCLAAIAALVYFDPFDWGLLNRLFGGSDPVAKAAPVDTTAYASVNLLNVDTDKIQSLVSVFEEAYTDYMDEPVNLAKDLEEQLNDDLEEFGINLEEDVLPWIGRSAGAGLLDVQFDSYGYPETADYFVAIETRDRDAADAFLLKLTDGISESWDVGIDTSTYLDTTIYIVDDPYEELAFARYGNLVIMANSEDSIEQVIDASEGDSLADDPVYRDMIGQLPKERMLTFYLPGSALADFYQGALEDSGIPVDAAGDIYEQISGMAFSLSLVDAGLQLDTLMAYNPDKLPDAQQEMLEAGVGSDVAADQLPGDTLVYISGQRLDLIWETYYDTLNESLDGDFEEALSELEDEIGIDLNTDFFPYLDGASAIAVFPSRAGFIANFAEINIGIALLSQTSDDDALLDTIYQFNRNLEDMDAVLIEETNTGDMTIFEATDYYSEEPVLAYGVGSGWFGIATSIDILEALPDPEDALSEDNGFRQAQDYLPSGMSVVGYIDFKDGLDEIRKNLDDYDQEDFDDTTFFIKPIQALIAGSAPFSDNLIHSTLILVIPTEN